MAVLEASDLLPLISRKFEKYFNADYANKLLNTRSIDITLHISLHIQMQIFFNTSEYLREILLAHCTLSSES